MNIDNLIKKYDLEFELIGEKNINLTKIKMLNIGFY